jgi:hypothetical protein
LGKPTKIKPSPVAALTKKIANDKLGIIDNLNSQNKISMAIKAKAQISNFKKV